MFWTKGNWDSHKHKTTFSILEPQLGQLAVVRTKDEMQGQGSI